MHINELYELLLELIGSLNKNSFFNKKNNILKMASTFNNITKNVRSSPNISRGKDQVCYK